MKRLCLFLPLLLSSCTPLISNVVMVGCGQDKVSLTNKAESDQTPTTPVNASIPVSVGAQPNSTATVTK